MLNTENKSAPACRQQQSRCSLQSIKDRNSTRKFGETWRTVEMNNVGESCKRKTKKAEWRVALKYIFSVIIVDQLMLSWWTRDRVTCLEECKAPLSTSSTDYCLPWWVCDWSRLSFFSHPFPPLFFPHMLQIFIFFKLKLHSPKSFPLCRSRQQLNSYI